MFVEDTWYEAARLPFESGGSGGKETVEEGSGAKRDAEETGTFIDIRGGTLEFSKCQMQVVELGGLEVGGEG